MRFHKGEIVRWDDGKIAIITNAIKDTILNFELYYFTVFGEKIQNFSNANVNLLTKDPLLDTKAMYVALIAEIEKHPGFITTHKVLVDALNRK